MCCVVNRIKTMEVPTLLDHTLAELEIVEICKRTQKS